MLIPVIPESAPFNSAQRAWLNGFLAGVLGLDRATSKAAMPVPAGDAAPTATPVSAPAVEEDHPWHEPTMPLADRLKLADGKPIELQLMAGMAQLDCGSCGYLCKTYAEAIATGADTDLSKCSPGGKETHKTLKHLLANRKSLPAATPATGPTAAVAETSSKPMFDRKNPFPAPFLGCRSLNRPGSAKDVRHVAINLNGSGLTYDVGDALGVVPENCPDLVEAVLSALGATGCEPVTLPNDPTGRSVHTYDALLRHCSIAKITEPLAALMANFAGDPNEASQLKAIADGEPAGTEEWWDLLDLLTQFPSARPPVAELIATLAVLAPRLYSISSSLKAHRGEVHLTVGVVTYDKRDRTRKGVASTYLTDRLRPRQHVKVFVHPSHGFRLPADPQTPIIMVGPGTGIAPFRAFLEERAAVGARGRNWLFFGDQRQESDFLYRDELETFQKSGLLTRLDLAFSRDQSEKIYVQNRMSESAADIWSWLQEGAHFYVCGDARRMALDVDRELCRIVETHGNMTPDAAREYVKQLGKAQRYQRDVY
jgi:sulfite reductase (NADPH) flavoprotein alpha-component